MKARFPQFRFTFLTIDLLRKTLKFPDDPIKSGHEFESPPQSKDPELTPEEEVQPDLMCEEGFSEATTYNLSENREAVTSVEPPPTVSTPQQNDAMLQSSEPLQSNSGYDSYLVGPPAVSPFSRRSPVFPGSSLFQVSFKPLLFVIIPD